MKILFTWPLHLFWVLSEWGENRDDTLSIIAVAHGQSVYGVSPDDALQDFTAAALKPIHPAD